MRWGVLGLLIAGCFPTLDCPPPDLSDVDGDGWTVGDGDCDDADPGRHPEAQEWCGNDIDEDCDGGDAECRLSGVLSTEDAVALLDGSPALGVGQMNGTAGLEWAQREGSGWTIWELQDDTPNQVGQISGSDGCCAHLRSVGDVTGDGQDDLLLGADQLYLHQPDHQAEVYVLPGPITDAVVPNHALVITGETEDSAGQALGGPLDFNGDGVGDVLIGTPGLMGNRMGGARVLFGPLSQSQSIGDAEVRLVGDEMDRGQGRSVTGVSDVNGDGLDEVLVGQSGGPDWEEGAYGAVLFLGQTTGGTLNYGDADDRYTTEVGEYAGVMSVCGAGDVNGDGYGDWLVASPLAANYAGKAWLFSGGAEVAGDGLDGAYAEIEGADSGDRLGTDLDALGDFDGDTVADIMVGAPHAPLTDVHQSEGAVFVMYGPIEGHVTASFEDPHMTVIHGTVAQDQVGGMSDSPGDLDGDGFSDLLLSSPRDGGRSWIFRSGSR